MVPRPGFLTQRNPEQQHHAAGEDDDPAKTQTGGEVDALGKHCPRVHAQACSQHHGRSEPEEKQASKKLN